MLADVISGTRCIQPAWLGDVAVLMRALSELEIFDALEDARALVMARLPGEPEDALVRHAFDRRVVSLASVDPDALRDGGRVPLLTSDDVHALAPAMVDALLEAQRTAQRRAAPRLDTAAQRGLQSDLQAHAAHAERAIERFRVMHEAPAVFFDVPPRRVTSWQHVYFRELSR